MADDEKPWGFHNRDPRRATRWDRWDPSRATTTVTADQAAAGWRPMAEVQKNRYVALLFRGGSMGDFEGAGAFYLEEGRWHAADSKMIFHADSAIAWKPWRKQSVAAEPLPPKGRRG